MDLQEDHQDKYQGNNPQRQLNKRRKAFFKGHRAELLACLYLVCCGYRVLARRFRTKAGEIDIIARKGDLVAIVEVKARHSEREAVDAVTFTAQRRIANAADIWLASRKDAGSLSLRFDIIAIMPWKLPVHFKDAF